MVHVDRRGLLSGLACAAGLFGELAALPSFAAPILSPGPSPPSSVGLILQIKGIIDSLNWGLSAGEALSRGAPPPDESKLTKQINKRIAAINDAIGKEEPPDFQAGLPDTIGPVPNTADAMRSYLSVREASLQDAAFEFLEVRDKYQGELQDIADTVQELSDTRGAVADALAELIKVATFPIVEAKLANEWLSLTLNAESAIGKCDSSISQKMREAKIAFANRAVAIGASGKGILNLLALEAAALKGEADILKQLETAVDGHRKTYAAEKAQLDRMALQVRTRKQDIAEQQDQSASTDSDIRDCNGVIGQKQRDLDVAVGWLNNWKANFDACPNKQPWDSCNHEKIKQQWYDTYVTPRVNAKSNLGRDIGNLQQRMRDLNRQRAEISRTIQDYQAKLALETRAYDEQYLLTATDKSELEAEQSRYDERRYTSKADLFALANGQSTNAITALLAKLQ